MVNVVGTSVQIAGLLTAEDWRRDRPQVDAGASVWERVFRDYFEQRLKLRYLNAVNLLEDKAGYDGAGFSIVTILCSLLEFLESTAQGINYRFGNGTALGEFEYNKSGEMIVALLTTRAPFSHEFNRVAAMAFYRHIRCALLHEASTKGGWRIWVRDVDNQIFNFPDRILYRHNLRCAVEEYISNYGRELVKSTTLQSAFLRKFDYLASGSATSAASPAK